MVERTSNKNVQAESPVCCLIYISTAMPLQGFCNWFVYMYPRFQKWGKAHPLCCPLGRLLRFSNSSGDDVESSEDSSEDETGGSNQATVEGGHASRRNTMDTSKTGSAEHGSDDFDENTGNTGNGQNQQQEGMLGPADMDEVDEAVVVDTV